MDLQELWETVQERGISGAAKHYGISRQLVYHHVRKHPEYKPCATAHKAPHAVAHCPSCASTRTIRNGRRGAHQQYICNECGFGWREKLQIVRASEIAQKILDTIPNI